MVHSYNPAMNTPNVSKEKEKLSEDNLVELAQQGSSQAIAALYNLYLSPLYRFCYWQTNRSEDAEDLTQDIFVEMAKSIHRFRHQSSFKNWLYILAKRRILAWIRMRYQLPTASLNYFEELSRENGEHWLDEENEERKIEYVEELLTYLSPRERQVMRLRYLQNSSVKEIAQYLHMKEVTAKVMCHRALKKLRQASEFL